MHLEPFSTFFSTVCGYFTRIWLWEGFLGGVVLICVSLFSTVGHASELIALERGCFNCHSNPPRRTAPSFQHLAIEFSPYKGQPNAASELAEKLRQQHFFGGIDAHERLSQYDATVLIQWVIDSAP